MVEKEDVFVFLDHKIVIDAMDESVVEDRI